MRILMMMLIMLSLSSVGYAQGRHMTEFEARTDKPEYYDIKRVCDYESKTLCFITPQALSCFQPKNFKRVCKTQS